ncbi:hypothetical protein GMD78_06230 [Ornithinibacillus sp. L9]|uniref:RNA polymerase sigma-70 region 4 domain-containing protein n=2 Tax=Ornithinibacillus caprae TaxID=2678566 RepID=A0A6N8FEY7_9BACI|nr:hypothetical protein [Ornithinibacillus caprae]
MKDFSKFPQVGTRRVQDVLERLREINYSITLNAFMKDEVRFESDMYITELFSDSKYIKFRSFCESIRLTKVKDIQPKHIREFATIRGVGEQKVTDIIAVLNNFSGSAMKSQELELKGTNVYEYIKHIPVRELLTIFHISGNTDSSVTIEDLEGRKISDIDHTLDQQHVLKLYHKLKKVKRPDQIINEIFTLLKDNERLILKYRFEDRLTLQETGEHFGITRERVRQIAKKAELKLKSELKKFSFYEVVQLFSTSKSYITYEDLIQLIGVDNRYIVEILKEQKKGFAYYEKLDIFFFNLDQNIHIDVLDSGIEDLPNIFLLKKFESTIRDLLESFGVMSPTLGTIQKLLEEYGFSRYGKFYSRKKLNVIRALEILFEHFIPDQLKLDEEGYEYLKELAKKHLDYELNSSLRAVDARLRDSSKLILVNRSTFQRFNYEEFDQSIIAKVKEYLLNRFTETNVVNVEEIYHTFERELKNLNIFHKLHLYSLIHYYLDEEFIIGKGNTLNIFKNDQAKQTIEESLMDVVNKFGGYCDKKQIEETLNWPPFKVDLGISSSKQLLSWGKNKVITLDYLGLSDITKTNLISLVEKTMDNGFTTAALVYREVMLDQTLSLLMEEKGIDDYWKMSSLLKAIFPTLKGHMNFLYVENCPFSNFEEVITYHFDRETTRKEIKDFALNYGYKSVMASQIVYKLLEQGTYVEIDMDTLYPREKFAIPSEVVQQVYQLVDELQGDAAYIALHKIDETMNSRIPDIGFRWNPYLIKTILIDHGYRQITKIVSDYRYDQILLVKENSPIQTFDELVYHILKHEYDGTMQETYVYEFLTEKGIFKEPERAYYKVLPNELKSNSNRIKVDHSGNVTLN